MWPANPPTHTVVDVADACRKSTPNAGINGRIVASLQDFVRNNANYIERVRTGTTWSARPTDFPLSRLTDDEMIHLYTRKLVGGKSEARDLYDHLRARARLRRCPYCNETFARTLDHFLPKRPFSSLALDPWNLVPSCSDCNRAMNNTTASSASTEFFHPYDSPNLDDWLEASIDSTSPVTVSFKAAPPASWPLLTRERLLHQFESLELAQLYTDLSASPLAELAVRLESLRAKTDAENVSQHLAESAEIIDRSHGKNHWRAALMRALAANRVYCDSAFANLA